MVVVDGVTVGNLDLSSCDIPTDVHALQWYSDHGELERVGGKNERLLALPKWAIACTSVWQVAYDRHRNPPAPTPEQVEANARAWRDNLLAACDWTQLPDTQLTDSQKQLWAAYRQSLRDVTTQVGFPTNIEWPTPPQ
jgi:hypothetical protein